MKMRKTIYIFILVVLALSITATHEAGHPAELSLDEFASGPQDPVLFTQLSPTDQQQYLKDQVTAGAAIYNDPELLQMATTYVQNNGFDPKTNPDDLEIAETLYGNPDTASNAETINQAPLGFQKLRQAKGNQKFTVNGKVRHYDHATGALSTEKQEIKLDSFLNNRYEIIVTKNNQIILKDDFQQEHTFEGSLDAFQVSFTSNIMLFMQKGTFDGHEIEQAAFTITDQGITGSAKTFHSAQFSKEAQFTFERASGKLIVSDGTKILSVTNAKIVGKNIKLPNGDILKKGQITYTDGKVSQIGGNSEAIVSGVKHKVKTRKPLEIRFATNDEIYKLEQEREAALKPYYVSPDLLIKKEETARAAYVLQLQRNNLAKEMTILQNDLQLDEDPQKRLELEKLQQQTYVVDEELRIANSKARTVARKVIPNLVKAEEIQASYREKRNKLFDQYMAKNKPEGNYFVYGKDRLSAAGNGFKSALQTGNTIFPEFKLSHQLGAKVTRQGRFELDFTKKGQGSADIKKISDDERPLALATKITGNAGINNGGWEFQTNGKHILAKTTESVNTKIGESRRFAAADMRFYYTTEDGEEKVYDLDVDTQFYEPLSESTRQQITTTINQKEQELAAMQQRFQQVINDPDTKATLAPLQARLERIRIEKGKIWDQEERWRGLLDRIPRDEASNQQQYQERRARYQAELAKLAERTAGLNEEEKTIEDHPAMKEMTTLSPRISFLSEEIGKLKYQRDANHGDIKTGAFGQVVRPPGGGSGLTYEEYVSEFPIRKNTDLFRRTKEVLDEPNVVTGSGGELDVPIIQQSNADKLCLDYVIHQECIDVQIRLATEYALKTGTNICFTSKGERICRVGSGLSTRSFMRKWMGRQGTGTYATEVTRQNPKDIEVIPPSQYDNIRAGDVILLNGHAVGVKEVVIINGKRYIRQFAGSQPAIDAHIYHSSHGGLISIEQLSADKTAKTVTGVFRWKFRGVPKSVDPEQQYILSTQR
jgi:hypothetical protein